MADLQTIKSYRKALLRLAEQVRWHMAQCEEWTEEMQGAFARADEVSVRLADDLFKAHHAEAVRIIDRMHEENAELTAMIAADRSGGGDRG